MELVAENRAIIDSLMYLEKSLKKEQIDTESLIKVEISVFDMGFIKNEVYTRVCVKGV